MKEFYMDVNQETINYLQRLGFEVDGARSLIDFMFDAHKNDTDTTLFDSVPWKAYMKKYEEANAAYALAKAEYGRELQNIVDAKTGKKNTIFDWSIDDFQEKKVRITIA